MNYMNPVPFLTMSPLLVQLNNIRQNLQKIRSNMESSQKQTKTTESQVVGQTQKLGSQQLKKSFCPNQMLDTIFRISLKTSILEEDNIQNQSLEFNDEPTSEANQKLKANERQDKSSNELLSKILNLMTPTVTEDIIKNCQIKIYDLEQRQEKLKKQIQESKVLMEKRLVENAELKNKLSQAEKQKQLRITQKQHINQKLLTNNVYK